MQRAGNSRSGNFLSSVTQEKKREPIFWEDHLWWGVHKKNKGERIGPAEQLSFTKPWQHCSPKASAKQRPPSASSASTQAAGQLSDELRPMHFTRSHLGLVVRGPNSLLLALSQIGVESQVLWIGARAYANELSPKACCSLESASVGSCGVRSASFRPRRARKSAVQKCPSTAV